MAGEIESIVLCEPQCSGFEHASFNAALLQTVLYAFPGARVVFVAEKAHLACVREKLTDATGGLDRAVAWIETAGRGCALSGWKRLKEEVKWVYHLLGVVGNEGAQGLVLCSLTVTGLFALKGLLLIQRAPEVPVVAVLHGILGTVESPSPGRLQHRILHLRQALKLPHPKQLAYLALGASIYTCLVEAMPQAARYFKVLDPPYFMDGTPSGFDRDKPIRFGYFGVGRNAEKAFNHFVRLAQEIQREPLRHESKFMIVGHMQAGMDGPPANPELVRGASDTPLAVDEYARRARTLTYAVSLADPAHYRLVVSASFLDALSYLKPGIYLRNPYVEHYFRRMGDIGYLCDSYEEVRDVVLSVARNFPEGRYRQQCENIRNGRRIFEPQTVAARLRDIVESQQALR